LVLCDNIYQDPTGKRALVGLFNRIVASSFPVRHPLLSIYVSVTSLRPKSRLKLEIVRADQEEELIASAEGQAPAEAAASPTTVCDLMFRLQNVRFDKPGAYLIRVSGNDSVLMQRPFDVRQAPGKEEKP
jgi:hypothetical protein